MFNSLNIEWHIYPFWSSINVQWKCGGWEKALVKASLIGGSVESHGLNRQNVLFFCLLKRLKTIWKMWKKSNQIFTGHSTSWWSSLLKLPDFFIFCFLRKGNEITRTSFYRVTEIFLEKNTSYKNKILHDLAKENIQMKKDLVLNIPLFFLLLYCWINWSTIQSFNPLWLNLKI